MSRKSPGTVTPLSERIDKIVDGLLHQERFKNSRILTSVTTAENYCYLKKALERFVRSKYHRDFSRYMFRDIDERFLREFAVYEQLRGSRTVTTEAFSKSSKCSCAKAKDEGIYGVNLSAFIPLKRKIRSPPKAVSHEIIQQIEQVDRSILK